MAKSQPTNSCVSNGGYVRMFYGKAVLVGKAMVAGRFLSTPIASRRAFSFAAFSLLASLRRSARPESQDVDDDAIARRDSDSLTLTA